MNMATFLAVAVPLVVFGAALRHAWPLFPARPLVFVPTAIVAFGIGASSGESVAHGGDLAVATNLEVAAALSAIAGILAAVCYARGEPHTRRGSMYVVLIGVLWLGFLAAAMAGSPGPR